ncbi:MAG TPA: flippase activity-associated protein Agl23 [Ktedonobacterales bacterium]|nr:flippase activity-associated protein Agl23 [Ktedonobacterales bacterium]
MSARQNDDRQSQKARDQQAHGPADLSAHDGQAALAFASTEMPQGSAVAQVPAPTEPTEPDADMVESEAIAGPSVTELLAGVGERLRRLPPSLWDFIRGRSVEQWAWFAVLAVAALLRFWNLGAKPLHHDESMHAFYSLLFARDPSSYAYDPLLHGPFQFHAEGFMFALILAAQSLFHVGGLGNNPWINDATARIVPALFGLGIVALPLGLRRELGRLGALLAALLLAVSPTFVYFSRFLREDIYFNFFMFAMVVCAVRFARSRTMVWLALLAASVTLAYATFEGIFLTFAIFGAFLAALVAWELAIPLARLLPAELDVRREPLPDHPSQPTPGPLGRLLPPVFGERRRLLLGRLIALMALAGVGLALAAWGLHTMKSLSAYIQAKATTKAADAQVLQLEQRTVLVLLYVSIALAAFVILALLWQITRDNALYDREERLALASTADPFDPTGGEALDEFEEPAALGWIERIDRVVSAPGRGAHALRSRMDPERQPLLRLLLGIPWTQWFVAFVVAWMLFAGLYWEFPNVGRSLGQGFVDGVGKGVWQGLYYWLQQQNVARGAQPIYYYFVLIPLYEQLAVVFGLAGVVYSLFRPTRFRMFLVWWFVGSLGIYSWAGEKMPWLAIHMLLPLMLLAAVMLALALERGWVVGRALASDFASGQMRPRLSWRSGGALASATLGVLLFIPMVHSMYLLAYQDPANGPLEMMVYVQTTPDVDTVMAKINQADQKLHGGRHQLNVVVGSGEEWPFYWYLRDYWMDPHPNTYVTFDPTSFQNMNPDVLILYPGADVQAFMAAHPTGYHMKEYTLRSWFDESYKPQLACETHPGTKCPSNVDYSFYGKGLGPWLSYGSNPPPNATFTAGRAIPRLWNWLWLRQPLGNTKGPYYDFVFIVRDGLSVQP